MSLDKLLDLRPGDKGFGRGDEVDTSLSKNFNENA
jgi:hypothetical protein